MARRKQPIIPD
jgi:putative transposase